MTPDNKILKYTFSWVTWDVEWSGFKDKILAQVEYEKCSRKYSTSELCTNSDLDKASYILTVSAVLLRASTIIIHSDIIYKGFGWWCLSLWHCIFTLAGMACGDGCHKDAQTAWG